MTAGQWILLGALVFLGVLVGALLVTKERD